MGTRNYGNGCGAMQEICAALKELMAQKPLNKITVAEIMKNCGMVRQHFYYHFEDIYDAVHWMFEAEAVDRLREYEEDRMWQDGLLHFFRYLEDNREVCLCALNSMNREHLKSFFIKDIQAIVQSTIQTIAGEIYYDMGERELTLLTAFYVGALVNMAEDWLLGEIKESPKELVEFMDHMLRNHARGGALSVSKNISEREDEKEIDHSDV